MRTNVEIDDKLLAKAMKACGQPTKRAMVEHALRTLIRLRDELPFLRGIPAKSEHRPRALTTVTRTYINIDDGLLQEALAATGNKTRRATIDEALHMVVLLDQQKKAVAELWGTGWEGDLEKMREGWSPPLA